METLELPQLSGGRDRAAAMVAGLPADLRGSVVVVDCRQLRAGTQSFADELVRLILVDQRAVQLQVVNVDDAEFARYFADAARLYGVTGGLVVDSNQAA